ncbi:MAG: hypothetical protein ACOYN3_09300 [Acidimicrobiia bacterium]
MGRPTYRLVPNLGRAMSWRRSAVILGIVAFAGLCALLANRQMSSQPSAKPPVPTTARIVGRTNTPPPTAPALTPEQINRVALLGASVSEGPGVAIEGDFSSASAPSAKSVGVLGALPRDWINAYLTAADVADAMGTPLADRGAALQVNVSPDIYSRWVQTLTSRKSAGVFTATRQYLVSPERATSGELSFVAIGTYKVGQTPAPTYVVHTTASRLRDKWVVTAIEFTEVAGRI